ncbi:leucine rich repeat protein [Cladophialophora carrionii]|uniref:Leucine rich repeat protein n=1 Tax=Cladophialophora carrionii TaxID=86049 RepID=A0A1C1D1U7_9EURO|nr:leucine rich repeat protein [Cladophialophora carrionii]
MADKRRRKSLSIFRQKADPSPSVQIPASPLFEKHSSEYLHSPVELDPASPKNRPRTLQKSGRASVFGSLRSLHSLDEDEKTALTRSDSKSSSLQEEVDMNVKGLLGSKVLQYGEVQAGSSNVFRKRNQFMVLTDTHLIRFRSQVKAAEMFPSIPSSLSKGHVPRSSSVSSYQELQSSAYSDITSGVPLEQVVAVFKIDDGRLSPTVEVGYLDERARRASAIQWQLNDYREAELWMTAIRSASQQARMLVQQSIQDHTVEHLARVLERERDYDPEHFHVFKVVQRSVNKSLGRASAEDLTRHGSATACYLVIGLHKIHLVPLQRSSTRSSSTSLSELDAMTSYAIVTLTSIKVVAGEDAFQFSAKPPVGQPYMIHLASYAASDIALHLRAASEYLRPEWVRQPFFFDVPPEIDDQAIPPTWPKEDHDCFDRTLIAYCAGYDVDTSRICYSVDYECEDAPCFLLLPPSGIASYSALELLAVFRALRYNESFSSISFARINITPLRQIYDVFCSDVDSLFTRSGNPVNIVGHQDLPVLCQEIRALALKSRRLRRMDFSNTMPHTARADGEEPFDCGILEALVPLCKRSLTNVDWIVLTGLRLSDGDLNYLVDAASERKCHLRALEIGDCGLSVHDIDVLLSSLSCQESTVEVIDISGAQGRFSPELFQRGIGAFTRIRRLNLTRIQMTAGPEPLVAPEVLLAWRLEALYLSQTTLNEQSVDSVSAYLATSKSDILRELHVNQCGLTGNDLATFFRSMSRDDKQPRLMHVSANENRLKVGNTVMFRTLGHDCGPTSLSMRMMDFEKESHFRELINALKVNRTLRSLDISRASLPYDASIETCEALREMFATNQTLEELDISGEHAHLDATRFGIGLNIALRGLEKNKSLKLLRIEHQGLGLQGASTLAEVLQKNETLLEIHCEHNDINLQSFTALVNALEKNHTLLFMSSMDHDRGKTLEKVRREIETVDRGDSPKTPKHHGGALKKAFAGTLTGKSHAKGHGHRHSGSLSSTGSYTDQDIAAVMTTLEEKWNAQVARMQRYLFRNYCRAQGVPWEESTVDEVARPATMAGESSLAQILQRVKLDRTPTAGAVDALDYIDEKLGRDSNDRMVFEMPKD